MARPRPPSPSRKRGRLALRSCVRDRDRCRDGDLHDAMAVFAKQINAREARLTADLKRARQDVADARAKTKVEKRALELERSQSNKLRYQRDEARDQLADAEDELDSLLAEHDQLKEDRAKSSACAAERLHELAKKGAEMTGMRAQWEDAVKDTTALRARLKETESELAEVVASKARLLGDRAERDAAVEKEVTQRLHRKLEGEVTLHLQKLGEVFGGLGLRCSGSDGGNESDEPSPVSAGEEDAGEEAAPELPVPAGPPTALAPASSSSDSSDS